MFQVSRPYLDFGPDPKHFIVYCEQNVFKFAEKWKMYWKMQFLHKIFRQIKMLCWQTIPNFFRAETWTSHIFLAHLSRRLTRWIYSIAMVRRPSVVVRRRRPSSVVVHTFKPAYLWSQLANLDQILCVGSLGWGKGCIRFWGRLDQNSGFHGNRKPPLTYNGKNDVSTFSRLFLIRSFLYLQVTRTCIKSQTSSNFGQVGPLTTEVAALERLKNFP